MVMFHSALGPNSYHSRLLCNTLQVSELSKAVTDKLERQVVLRSPRDTIVLGVGFGLNPQYRAVSFWC